MYHVYLCVNVSIELKYDGRENRGKKWKKKNI